MSMAIMESIEDMASTTISISEEVRRELLRMAAELQARIGERVDYDQVLRHLLAKTNRDEALLREACSPVKIAIGEVRKELRKEEAEDRKRERVLERRYS